MSDKKKEEKEKTVCTNHKKSEILTERKIETYGKALKAALKEEPPEEQIRILKILVKDAKARIRAADPNADNQDELVENWEKAEGFAENIKTLCAESGEQTLKSRTFRLLMAVRKEDYKQAIGYSEEIRTILKLKEPGAEGV